MLLTLLVTLEIRWSHLQLGSFGNPGWSLALAFTWRIPTLYGKASLIVWIVSKSILTISKSFGTLHMLVQEYLPLPFSMSYHPDKRAINFLLVEFFTLLLLLLLPNTPASLLLVLMLVLVVFSSMFLLSLFILLLFFVKFLCCWSCYCLCWYQLLWYFPHYFCLGSRQLQFCCLLDYRVVVCSSLCTFLCRNTCLFFAVNFTAVHRICGAFGFITNFVLEIVICVSKNYIFVTFPATTNWFILR